MKTNPVHSRATALTALGAAAVMLATGGCVTSRIEQSRDTYAGSGNMIDGEAVVLLTRRVNNERQTEAGFSNCVGELLAEGETGLEMRTEQEFLDSLFPWFEPRYAPNTVADLPVLLEKPGVAERIADSGVRFIVWLDGETETIDGGGSISCDLTGMGCLGFQWWEKDSSYEAAIWDLKTAKSAGIISTDATGTSYMPAIVIPIPLIARTKAAACKGLAGQLKEFLGEPDV